MIQNIDCVDWNNTNDEAMRVFQARLPNALRVNSVGQMGRDILARLTSRFIRGGWAELHGCSVAASAAGWNLLKGLARLWQVNVSGGVVTQTTNPGFEVAYRVAQRNGQVRWRRGHN